MAATAAGLTNGATCTLIAIWEESSVQEKLYSIMCNKAIYEDLEEKFKAQGLIHKWHKCCRKAKNLTQKYRKV